MGGAAVVGGAVVAGWGVVVVEMLVVGGCVLDVATSEVLVLVVDEDGRTAVVDEGEDETGAPSRMTAVAGRWPSPPDPAAASRPNMLVPPRTAITMLTPTI